MWGALELIVGVPCLLCSLSFVFLGGARCVELSPCNTTLRFHSADILQPCQIRRQRKPVPASHHNILDKEAKLSTDGKHRHFPASQGTARCQSLPPVVDNTLNQPVEVVRLCNA